MKSCTELENVTRTIHRVLETLRLPENPVIIFDVDNTLVDSYSHPIKPVIDVYHHAVNRGILPMIVTARVATTENIEMTRQMLRSYGIFNYDRIYFRPMDKGPDPDSQARFKFMARKNIFEQGYNAVMSIGDMPWDIGEYGGIGYIVPVCKAKYVYKF